MPERHITREQVKKALQIGRKVPSFRGRQLTIAMLDDVEITVVFKEEADKIVVITAWRNPPWEGE